MTRKELKNIVREIIFEVVTEEFSKDIVSEMANRIQNKIKPSNKYSLSNTLKEEDDPILPSREEITKPTNIREILKKKTANPDAVDPLVVTMMEQVVNDGGLNEDDVPEKPLPQDHPLFNSKRNRVLAGMEEGDGEDGKDTKIVAEQAQPRRKVYNPQLDEEIVVGTPKVKEERKKEQILSEHDDTPDIKFHEIKDFKQMSLLDDETGGNMWDKAHG